MNLLADVYDLIYPLCIKSSVKWTPDATNIKQEYPNSHPLSIRKQAETICIWDHTEQVEWLGHVLAFILFCYENNAFVVFRTWYRNVRHSWELNSLDFCPCDKAGFLKILYGSWKNISTDYAFNRMNSTNVTSLCKRNQYILCVNMLILILKG